MLLGGPQDGVSTLQLQPVSGRSARAHGYQETVVTGGVLGVALRQDSRTHRLMKLAAFLFQQACGHTGTDT